MSMGLPGMSVLSTAIFVPFGIFCRVLVIMLASGESFGKVSFMCLGVVVRVSIKLFSSIVKSL